MVTTAIGSDGNAEVTTSRAPVRHSTRGEDGVTLALGAWVIGGMFLDGYAHAYVIDTATEDFFTPWHAIFYAGFVALAGWIGLVGYRRRRPAASPLEWFPTAYRPALIGLLIFAIGGVGDGIWHTVFGVEVGIDALLSPTHLILFAGGILLLWTPVRASAARADPSPYLSVGAVALVTSLLVFLTEYLWLLPNPWWASQPFDAVTGEGYGRVQVFLGAAIVVTIALVGPLRLIARRWALPFGSATFVWGLAAALHALAFSQQLHPVILSLVGGLAHDLTLLAARGRRGAAHLAAFVGPAVLFAGYLVWVRLDQPLGWPPEIWGGLVVLSGFAGLAVVLIQDSGRGERIIDPSG